MSQPLTVALLPWGDVIEDFLDSIGVSFESFCNDMTGGWLFGYVDALRTVGVRTVLFCISNRVTAIERHLHKPTGATICVLPALKLHSQIHRRMQNPYAYSIEEVFSSITPINRSFYKVLRDLSFYLATPLHLLAQELQQQACQAIVCQEYEYARFDACVLLGQWLRLPVFATFQGGDFQLSRLERPLRPLALRACAGLIVATQTEIHRLQSRYGISSTKIAQIFNPIDVKNWHVIDRQTARAAIGLAATAQVVVYHGRIELHRKGLDILLAAWEQLCQALPGRELCLLLVGTGSSADQLRQLITDKQLSNILWIDEYVRDRAAIQQYLAAADVYTLPSRHEGFPVAPIEAMASGLPIVATDAPGIPDILAGGEQSGGIVVPREDPIALAAALQRVLIDRTFAAELGQRARLRAETSFSLEAIGSQLRAFLWHETQPTDVKDQPQLETIK